MDWQKAEGFRGRCLTEAPVILEEVDSTNSEALRRIAAGTAPDGTVLLARHQTGGRGRRGRQWQARTDTAVLLSVVLEAPSDVPMVCFTMLGAVSVTDLLDSFDVTAVRLKWPNDVLVADRKVAGILAETQSGGRGRQPVVLGIGLNVVHQPSDLPENATPPTSLHALGASVTPPEAAVGLLQALDARLTGLRETGPSSLAHRFSERLELPGRPVRVETIHETLEGQGVAVEVDGTLILRTAVAETLRVPAAHIRSLNVF